MRLAVSFVIGSLGLGGAEQHLLRIMPMLAAKGLRVSTILLNRQGVMIPYLRECGIEVIEPPAFIDVIDKRIPKIGRVLALPVLMGWLFRELLCRRKDIVHFFLPEAYILGMPCAWLSNPHRPMLMSRRSLNDYQKKYPFANFIERMWHQKMRYVLGNSQAVIAQLWQEGVPSDRLRLIYNGVEGPSEKSSDEREKIRHELGITSQALVMVIVANLIPYKGHQDLLQALSQCKGLPSDWVLLCVGRDDGIGDELKVVADRLHIADHIQWLGMRMDVADILQAADIALLVSHQEGFSNAILEYMAAGLPVIATDVGGNAEAIVDHESGVIVPAHAPEILAEAIALLAKNEGLRNGYGQAGMERMREHFSLDRCVEAYEALYSEILNGSSGKGVI